MMQKFRIRSLLGLLLTAVISSSPASGESAHESHVSYRVANVDGLSIFYREAGPRDAPTVLLLHGFPSSSRMFEPLLRRLGDQYHLVAPDFPGFGHSDAPSPASFAYTLYMQDYGGPVGFRMALARPERVNALIVQNAVSHEDGLGPLWVTRRAFWADRQANEAAVEQNLMSLQAAKQRHIGSSPNVESYDPDLWTDEYAFLSRPGQREIQSDLFYDYRTNVASYPRWQAWMQKTQPRTLVVWGRYDPSFLPAEADAYRRDLPKAEIHVLDAGHFALDEKPDEIAALIRAFLAGKKQ
jgi:pimeloyl-ACP methyl ester carboxylesterase